MKKCEVISKQIDSRPIFRVTFNLTTGELIAMKNLMDKASTSVQEDIAAFFANAASGTLPNE